LEKTFHGLFHRQRGQLRLEQVSLTAIPTTGNTLKQQIHSATLDNGITILGESMPGVESVAVAFHVPAGAVHDPVGRCGLATLAGEMCLRGAGNRTSRQIVEALEGSGVSWGHAVSATHTSFFGGMVARQLPAVLPVYVDILRQPRLAAEEFESARQMVLQNLAGIEDDPGHRTLSALRRIHMPAPWGMPTEGISADVEAATPADVEAFVASRMRPAGMIVTIAGRIDWDDAVAQITRFLGDWRGEPGGAVATGPRGPSVSHLPHDSQQTHIALAWSVPPSCQDESVICKAVLSILGGGTSSRLFTEVREKRGLCYGVSAGYTSLRDMAAATCHAGTTAARAQETLDVILAEIDRLPGSIETDELERVKARVTSGLVMQQESTASRAGSMASQWYHHGQVRSIEEDIARYDRLTVTMLEDWLASRPPRDLSVVSLGPEPLEISRAVSP
jgi:predicted Zn-dependent peptidase